MATVKRYVGELYDYHTGRHQRAATPAEAMASQRVLKKSPTPDATHGDVGIIAVDGRSSFVKVGPVRKALKSKVSKPPGKRPATTRARPPAPKKKRAR